MTTTSTMIQGVRGSGFDGLYFGCIFLVVTVCMGKDRQSHLHRDFTLIHKSFVSAPKDAPIRGTIIEVRTTCQLQLHLVCNWKKIIVVIESALEPQSLV